MKNVSEVWEIGDSGNKRSMRNRGWRKRTTFGDSMMDDGYFSDPDDVICEYFGFGARFRTPAQLFRRKGIIWGVFQANSDYAVR
ncbi:hypothetical protein MKZ23_19865 [Paenibacillus sp. FSL R5-0876]|uniref:hypothetical protein n=1 Tax=Paenibacillus sp. FSL R5-0876 TaxID=2921661 RepID=UPI0030F98DB2